MSATDINDWPGHPDADRDCECCLGDGLQADGETPCPCIDARNEPLAAQASTDQYRRAPIPADGRTIEAMRLALLDTPEGRAMTNAGDTRLYWMNESDAHMLMSPFGIESPFINTTDDALAKARAEQIQLAEYRGFALGLKVARDQVASMKASEGVLDKSTQNLIATSLSISITKACHNHPPPAPDAVEAEKDQAARRLLSMFMLDCNAIGHVAAAENLVRGIKNHVAIATLEASDD